MAISIPRSLVDYILLGPTGDRRQIQDSPILGDVWISFAVEPAEPQELLITPYKTQTAGEVAMVIDDLVEADRGNHQPRTGEPRHQTDIASLQGVIAAQLYFDEMLRVVVPLTSWWASTRNRTAMRDYLNARTRRRKIQNVVEFAQTMVARWGRQNERRNIARDVPAFDRYAALSALILWAASENGAGQGSGSASEQESITRAIEAGKAGMVDCLLAMLDDILKVFSPVRGTPRASLQSLVYQISLNRQASMALTRSVPAVKADAAHKLFTVDCSEIVWAVVDSGIQGDHPAFKARDGKSSRVRRAFDFSNFRKIVSLNNLRIFSGEADEEVKNASLKALLHKRLKNKPSKKDAIRYLTSLANDAKSRRPVHWEFVEPFVEIKPETHPTVSDHGTHVAGIIGASKTNPLRDQADEDADGMCPNIGLYDFRVLAESSDIKDTEFAIIAALQYIRHVNERHDFITIHGANLSLSIPHDVRNYACGRTPVCDECERLINSGVVVVAAAGNFGYQSFQTKDGGSYEGYTAFSITDPGNADGVITVGATHRFWPHTYGVSFFSSRGPTGDGRLKPDLVAPGERIRAPFREGWDDLDGTSMAAPHVSGAAAMLMARYSELIGQPRRIKRILCDNATDLGRERSFQGHGMLDVLRAFQSL